MDKCLKEELLSHRINIWLSLLKLINYCAKWFYQFLISTSEVSKFWPIPVAMRLIKPTTTGVIFPPVFFKWISPINNDTECFACAGCYSYSHSVKYSLRSLFSNLKFCITKHRHIFSIRTQKQESIQQYALRSSAWTLPAPKRLLQRATYNCFIVLGILMIQIMNSCSLIIFFYLLACFHFETGSH